MPQAATLRDRAAAFRPRFVRDAIVLGKSTVLARRVVERGCYGVDKPDDDALAALLSLAYEKRIHRHDPILLSVLRAADVLLKSPDQVDAYLAHLPESSATGLGRLPQAERLLKVGTRPADLARAMRRERLDLREAPAYADHLTLCDKGVVLGRDTVIAALEEAPGDNAGLAVKGREERILALLSVASNRAIGAGILAKFEAASSALGKDNVSLAAIHLAHVGLPPLAHMGMAKALGLAADELDKGVGPFELLKGLDLLPAGISAKQWGKYVKDYNPNEPRDYHGRWTTGGGGTGTKPNDGRVQVADNRPLVARNDASRETGGEQVASSVDDKKARDDKLFPSVVMTLADGATVISPYDGKPIEIPKDVSLQENVKIGEYLGRLNIAQRYLDMMALFLPGGDMDYQRTHSSDPDIMNTKYISFGNFNFGAVAAAAGYSEDDSIYYAALANQLGSGDKSGAHGGNPRNEQMIRAGWEAYHDGKISTDKRQ